jgi:excisionase family DNA binding protein
MEPEPLLISRPQAAKLLGVSDETIVRMGEDGTLEPVYLHSSAHPRFRRSDVVDLVEPPRAAVEAAGAGP